jgi:predicted transcriptional regulator
MKTTFSFDETVSKRLETIADHEKITKTEVLRRAITLYDFLEEKRGDNKSLTIIDKDGKEIEIIMP